MNRLWLPGLVWTDGSGRHSSNPHFRRYEVAYYIHTGESVWLPFSGHKQSIYRAELLAVVRALEERQPASLGGSDCKGVVACLHALRAGRKHPKRRHRDLESRALVAMPAGVNIVSMKTHQSDRDAADVCNSPN
eukprot:2467288-Amphidinium_carterae.1